MPGFKVAICHQTVVWGDAIGHDIVAMYRLIQALGGEPVIVCEGHRHLSADLVSARLEEVDLDSLSLLIYHHSQYWGAGERLLTKTQCPILLRYHNITPARFFAPYSPLYTAICAEGRNMTRRLLEKNSHHLWIADSTYNKGDLVEAGADPSHIRVVPPFNRVASLLPCPNHADYDSQLIQLLFVGRLAPNKGHSHLFKAISAFLLEVGTNVRLRIVGAIDPELSAYYADLMNEIAALNLEEHVEFLPHCSDAELLSLFRTAHVYLCFSEHEGFCVPVVEAQAVGLPVVGSGATAVNETAGPDQFIGQAPVSAEDYSFYAALIDRTVRDSALRSQLILQGERNVRTRFVAESIENAFTGALYEVLQTS
jgi:glycosyltransferase involved in cell wall biosynthesis